MRRLILDMTQTALGEAVGITFQQVQKYEKGINRISASRLQQMANVLQVPVPFFFEGLPDRPAAGKGKGAPSASIPLEVSQFIASSDGIRLMKAYTQIKRPALHRAIIALIGDLSSAS